MSRIAESYFAAHGRITDLHGRTRAEKRTFSSPAQPAFSAVLDDIGNPTVGGTNGWFAQEGGTLPLTPLDVIGDGDYTWREDPADPVLGGLGLLLRRC